MTSSTHQPNLLTSPADSTWHTIRKAVAQSFAFNNVKRKLPLIVSLDSSRQRKQRIAMSCAAEVGTMFDLDHNPLSYFTTLSSHLLHFRPLPTAFQMGRADATIALLHALAP